MAKQSLTSQPNRRNVFTIVFGAAIAVIGADVVLSKVANDDNPDSPPPGHAGSLTGGPVGLIVARGEGSYTSFNRGIAGDAHGRKIDFSEMEIREVMRRQSLERDDPDRLFAVGKYQIIPATMRLAVHSLRLSLNTKFGPETQETIFRDFLIAVKQPAVKAYITGVSDDRVETQEALAAEFASVANPYTGRSNYGGIGGNAASTSAAETATALDKERDSYRSAINAGKSSNEAWEALSGFQSSSKIWRLRVACPREAGGGSE